MPLWPGPIPAPAVKRGSFLIFKQTAMSFPLQPLLYCAGLTPFTAGLQLLEHSGSSASMTQVDGEILLLSFGDTGVAPPVSLFLDSSIDAGLIVRDTAASDPITPLTEVESATTGGGLRGKHGAGKGAIVEVRRPGSAAAVMHTPQPVSPSPTGSPPAGAIPGGKLSDPESLLTSCLGSSQ